jgi:DnaJ-domain-containing protein 1
VIQVLSELRSQLRAQLCDIDATHSEIEEYFASEKKTFELEITFRRSLKNIHPERSQSWFEKSGSFSKAILPRFSASNSEVMFNYFEDCWHNGLLLNCDSILGDLFLYKSHLAALQNSLKSELVQKTMSRYEIEYDISTWESCLERCYRQLMDKVQIFCEYYSQSSHLIQDLKTMGFRSMPQSQELRQRYIELVKMHHPDKGGQNQDFQKIQTAYEKIAKICASCT